MPEIQPKLEYGIRFNMKNQTRRKFISDSAKITGAVIVTSTLGQGLLFAQTPEDANIQFPESNCGSKNKEGHKILISYASECGTTGEVAEAIGDALCQDGNTVETKWIKNVKDINNYDAVIIGSAILYEDWMPEAREFVKNNQDILKNMPVAYFITCMALSSKKDAAMQQAIEYSDKLCDLVSQVKPISVGHFAGVLDYSKISFFKRILTRAAMARHKVKEGDYRDWNAIHSWARSIDFHSV
jgi:menaquinone-dependent protoporphyrinogen oxidase